MKKTRFFLIPLFFIAFSYKATAQKTKAKSCNFYTDSITHQKIYTMVTAMPTYKGGTQKMLAFMQAHYEYPKDYKGNELIIARFVVDEKGQITNIKMVKSSKNKAANANYISMLKTMPAWTPGKCNDKTVKVDELLPMLLRKP